MINLLPPDIKTSYIYGRRNVVLRKWIVMLLVSLISLGALGTYGLLSIKQNSIHYNKQIDAANQQLKKDQYEATQKRAKDITGSFRLVVQVLGQEVLFSQLLKQIATTIPPNASLTGLNISQVKGGIDITASAIDYNTASQVQVNLADPQNKIFSKADILSINCAAGDNKSTDAYPCTVNIRALFADDNPFLFINSKGTNP